jgi:hypothetical protein
MNIEVLSLEERIKTGCSHRAVIDYTDLTDTASTAKTLVPLALAARDIISFAWLDLVKTFDGGATSTMTLSFGVTSATTTFINAAVVHQDGTEILSSVGTGTRYAAQAAINLEVVCTATGANLTALTQGRVHLYFNLIRPTELRPLSAP